MKPQLPEKVSINSHDVTCTQNVCLPIQNFPSNRTNNNSNSHQVRINNPSRIIFGQININSIRNKFAQLIYIVSNEIDILMVSETKLDETKTKTKTETKPYITVFNATLLNAF